MSQDILYVIIAFLSGSINCLVAWFELDKKCRCLPFFEPLKTFGFWLWSFIQIAVPSLVFWYIFIVFPNAEPPIDLVLAFQSLTTGLIFSAVLNASTEIGTLSINIKPLHDLFLEISYQLIACQYISRTAKFWFKLEQELNQGSIDIRNGLLYLEQYFSNDFSLSAIKKQEIQNQLQTISQLTQATEKIKAILTLFKTEIRRKDLPRTLKNFNCSDRFLQDWNLKT